MDARAERRLFQIFGACTPRQTGVGTVDLTGASFSANSEPETGQGQSYDLSLKDWQAQWLHTSPTWHLIYLPGTTESSDGPNTGCPPP